MSKIIIAGGGASGMFASIMAASLGHEVHVFEKNEKLGKKLFITGKGRCNITNACDQETLNNSVLRNRKFLFSAFYKYNNFDVIDFFEQLQVKTKIERGNRVFPQSDHSFDVIKALQSRMNELGVQVHLRTAITNIETENGYFSAVLTAGVERVCGDTLLVATGGLSYQTTGSTGDGYKWAKKIGHTVTDLYPALVPLECEERWIGKLQGLSLKNVSLKLYEGASLIYEDSGEMLFTHFGVSGPLVLSASSFLTNPLNCEHTKIILDLKPALSFEKLDARVLRDFRENTNRQFSNALGKLFPAKLIPVMIELSGIESHKKVNEITKEERHNFVRLIKALEIRVVKTRGYNEAIITRGGVDVKEIHPATMESKKVKQVYFIGEILDLDALTGGFNLQIAWSTAYAACQNL